jgi:hypothetical protein
VRCIATVDEYILDLPRSVIRVLGDLKARHFLRSLENKQLLIVERTMQSLKGSLSEHLLPFG